jgi:hypothetical protein
VSYSQAAICNIALGHLGINRLIIDLESERTSKAQAQACITHYDLALEVTLKAFRWPFAQRIATLAVISGYSGTVWAYGYRAPSDCLTAHAINRTEANPQGERFEVGGDANGAIIYTNAEDAVLDYTASVTQPGIYPADFVEALAYQLAIRVAQPLSAEESLRQVAKNGYRDAIAEAMTNSANTGAGLEQPDDGFLATRGLATED